MKIKVETKCSLYKSLLNAYEAYPNAKALYFKGDYYTYKHLIKRVNQFSYKLIKLGLKKGDTITLILPNIVNAIYLLYSANQIGVKVSLIHPLMKEDEAYSIIKRTKSKIVFVLDSRYKDFKKFEDLIIISTSPVDDSNFLIKTIYNLQNKGKFDDREALKSKEFYSKNRYTKYENEFLEGLIYLETSGTSGKSKTIELSNFAINSLVTNFNTLLGLEDAYKKSILSTLPMFHAFGLVMGVHLLLYFGGCLMLMPKFSTKETISLIHKRKLNFLIGIPLLYEALLRKKEFSGKGFEKLDLAFVGGDFSGSNLINRFNNRMIENNSKCRLYEGYGLTETSSVVSVNSPFNYKIGSVGKVLKNVEIKFFDNKNEGEILVKGDTLMNKYLFNEQDEESFVTINNQKYFKTGDYGKIDDDGFLYIKNRIKRIIVIKGINIFPSEIEEFLESLNYIKKAVCLSEFINNDNKIKLYIELVESEKNIDYSEEISNSLIKKMGEIVHPYKIIFVDKFKYNNVGKIDINSLCD